MSAGRLTVIAYQWEADRYCGRCTASHFVPNTVGMLTERPELLDGLTLEEWVDREALTHEWIDAEGNTVSKLYSIDEWQSFGDPEMSGQLETLACSACGETLDEYQHETIEDYHSDY